MSQLIFIEGVSGAGKTTMAARLAKGLSAAGRTARAYLEFDSANPIDFYATAALTRPEFLALAARYPVLNGRGIPAGDHILVRYYDQDAPLFPEPLLSELAARELCYHPPHPLPPETFTSIFASVWRNFAENPPEEPEFLLFDGSLLQHPLNDMMRSYRLPRPRLLAHIQALWDALGDRKRRVFYLWTEDLPGQLAAAREHRGQTPPTPEEIDFWLRRRENDLAALPLLGDAALSLNVTGRWDEAREEVLRQLLSS